MKKMIHALMALVFLCLSSCKETPTPPRVELVPPSLPPAASLKVNLPANAHTQVRDFVDEIYRPLNTVYKMYEKIKEQEPLHRGSLWAWTSVSPFGTITLEAIMLAGDSSAWKLYYNYNGIGLNNWINADGKVTAYGKYGAWKFYQPNSTTLDRSLTWLKNEQNVLTIDATRFYDASPIDDIPGTYVESKLVGQPDNSGSLKAFDQGARIFEAQWDAAGAGSWAAYHPYTGQQIEGGSWR